MAQRTKIRKSIDQYAIRAKIHRLLSEIEGRLESLSSKASVADYTRLQQLERELDEDDRPREIRVIESQRG